ncbi:carbohydrate binding domain-containing protein [Flavobacterium sp. N2820]|uniref:carbohydrate binding domain-containing protein n=1 Tax=Flavobacterium sp. N2820 TaxID=2986834 RepID=UPI0022248135|nr:carbohydrate binding domain-containing protein [Flavobacterium sp. N2820]
MKKITFLLTLMTCSLGFAQNLVTNGDFQTGTAAPWYNNAANVVDLGGGNFVNQANVGSAGNPWDVNLSQEVLLEDGKTYKFTFDAFTDATTGSRTIVAGLGQTGAPFASLTFTPTLTPTPQTFSYDVTINYGNAVTDRVIFDMGAATGFVFIDNVSVVEVLPLVLGFESSESGGVGAEFGVWLLQLLKMVQGLTPLMYLKLLEILHLMFGKV